MNFPTRPAAEGIVTRTRTDVFHSESCTDTHSSISTCIHFKVMIQEYQFNASTSLLHDRLYQPDIYLLLNVIYDALTHISLRIYLTRANEITSSRHTLSTILHSVHYTLIRPVLKEHPSNFKDIVTTSSVILSVVRNNYALTNGLTSLCRQTDQKKKYQSYTKLSVHREVSRGYRR